MTGTSSGLLLWLQVRGPGKLKTLLMGTEDNVLTSQSTSWIDGLQLAGFQVTLTGRFWVTPEGQSIL